jgi:hypothetical protein
LDFRWCKIARGDGVDDERGTDIVEQAPNLVWIGDIADAIVNAGT